MSKPTLTPSQTTSVITLPITGTTAVASITTPLGMYSGETDFLSGAYDQVAYTYKKLGGDILDIELTEHSFLKDQESAVKAILLLKEFGVSFSLDDFGTGYNMWGTITVYGVKQ